MNLTNKQFWAIVILTGVVVFALSFFYFLNLAKQDPAKASSQGSLDLNQDPTMLNYTYIDINLPCLNSSKIFIFNDDKNLTYNVLCWKNLTSADIPEDQINDSLSYIHE